MKDSQPAPRFHGPTVADRASRDVRAERRAFSFTAELEKLLTGQQAVQKRHKKAGRIIPWVSIPTITYPYGINDSGHIVGGYEDFPYSVHGFLRSGGSFSTIDAPGADMTVSVKRATPLA